MSIYINEDFNKTLTRLELMKYANVSFKGNREKLTIIKNRSYEVWRLVHYDEKPTNVDEYSKIEEVGYRIDTSGKVQRTYRVVDREFTDEYLYNMQLDRLNAECNSYLEEAISSYPSTEVASFDKQEAEAKAYLAGATTELVLLPVLATSRGISLDELVKKVLEKATMFAKYTGFIIGQRQKFEDQLDVLLKEGDTNGLKNFEFHYVTEIPAE